MEHTQNSATNDWSQNKDSGGIKTTEPITLLIMAAVMALQESMST